MISDFSSVGRTMDVQPEERRERIYAARQGRRVSFRTSDIHKPNTCVSVPLMRRLTSTLAHAGYPLMWNGPYLRLHFLSLIAPTKPGIEQRQKIQRKQCGSDETADDDSR